MHLMDRDLYSPFKGVNRGGLVGKRMGNMAILISESTESTCLKLSLVSGLLLSALQQKLKLSQLFCMMKPYFSKPLCFSSECSLT